MLNTKYSTSLLHLLQDSEVAICFYALHFSESLIALTLFQNAYIASKSIKLSLFQRFGKYSLLFAGDFDIFLKSLTLPLNLNSF